MQLYLENLTWFNLKFMNLYEINLSLLRVF